MKKIQFDTHGMTDECPITTMGSAYQRYAGVSFDMCRHCQFYGGYREFEVYCKFRGQGSDSKAKAGNSKIGLLVRH